MTPAGDSGPSESLVILPYRLGYPNLRLHLGSWRERPMTTETLKQTPADNARRAGEER